MNPDLLWALDNKQHVFVKYITKKFTYRLMNCTRLLGVLPDDMKDGINIPKLNGELIIPVYDWDNRDWRSFRWDSVKEWRINND